MADVTDVAEDIVEETEEKDNTPEEETSDGSKLDLEKVDINSLPDELKKIAKSLQADYTRKTQSIAEQRKEIDQKAKKAEETLDWYSKNEQSIAEFNEWKEKGAVEKTIPVEDLYDGAEDYEGIKKLKAEYDQKLTKVQTEYAAAMQQGYNQIKDLVDIKIADPTADWDEIMKAARENGIYDMRKAYNIRYENKLTQKKIDEAVAAKTKEIEEKTKADVLTTVAPLGRQTRKVIKPKDRR